MKTFKEFLAESEIILEFKDGQEYSKDKIMDKIKSGDWESMNDVEPGKTIQLKHYKGKKVMVRVKK